MLTTTQQSADSGAASSTATRVSTTPPLARDIIDRMMSPFCPGLSLTACPSPLADSLRQAIIDQVRAGQKEEQIVSRLYSDYGTAIRGAPEFEGFGMVGWLAPGVAFLLAAFVVTRWIRKSTNRQRASSDALPTSTHASRVESAYSDEERNRLAQLLRRAD